MPHCGVRVDDNPIIAKQSLLETTLTQSIPAVPSPILPWVLCAGAACFSITTLSLRG